MFLKDRLKITSQRKYTDEGFLKVPARIARTGIQEYYAAEMNADTTDPMEIIKVYRPPEEVFSQGSLDSFSTKPVTNNHPPVLVDAENAKEYSVGMSGPEITQDGDYVSAMLIVTDAEAIKNIESGKVELSNGYTSDVDWTPGISPEGEQYDAIQRNIKGNHIAIVERGRAGPSCKVADNQPSIEENLMKITIDGVDYEVSDQAGQAVTKLQTRCTDMEKEAKEKDEEMKKKEDEMEEKEKEAKKAEDSLKAKLDDAKSKLPTADQIDKMVVDRADFLDSVRKVFPDISIEGKTQDAIMKEVVGVKCSSVQLDSVSEDYIKSRFDMLVETVNENSQQNLDQAFTRQVVDSNSDEDNRPASIKAREKMMADSKEAWKFGGRK